jgi:RNA polymerase sigma-70 factor (ECF subfamily)
MSGSCERDALDEQSLIHGLQNGDADAFESFVRLFTSRALQIAQRILENEADAADAVQDAFTSATRSIGEFRTECQLATWFHRIATNAALMRLRAKRGKNARSIGELAPDFYSDGHRVGPQPAWARAPDEILEQADSRRMIYEKISQLPQDFRNVVLLRDIQQVGTAEAARQLGVSGAVVKTRLHRARQALRSMLEEELVVD